MLVLVLDVEAGNTVGDVIDEAGEEEHLEVLVEVDQLNACDTQVADCTVRRGPAVGKRAMGCGFDGSEGLSAKGRKAVGQSVGSSDGSGRRRRRNACGCAKSGAEESDGSEEGVHLEGCVVRPLFAAARVDKKKELAM